MSRNIAIATFVIVVCSGIHSARSQVPAAPHTGGFLGIPGALTKIHGAVFNRHGLHPKLEKKPPLTGIAAAENLESADPALKRAAEIKAEEDKAKQKIKAIRYLAFIGCGCYDKDGSITAALIAKMSPNEECTERVRLAAVEAIEEVASGQCCSQCGQTCCCNEAIVKQLAMSAYHRDDKGCYVEPSARVREAAARALAICCSDESPVVEIVEEQGYEQPDPEVPETGEEGPETGEDGGDATNGDALDLESSDITGSQPPGSEMIGTLPQQRPAPTIDPRAYQDRSKPARVPARHYAINAAAFTERAPVIPARSGAQGSGVVRYVPPQNAEEEASSWRGVITHIDVEKRLAQVKLQDRQLVLPENAMLAAVQAEGGRKRLVGPFRTVRSAAGSVLVVMPEGMDARIVNRGDVVVAAPQHRRAVEQQADRLAPVVGRTVSARKRPQLRLPSLRDLKAK